MRQLGSVAALLCGLYSYPGSVQGQSPTQPPSAYDPLNKSGYHISPLSQPTFTPGTILLLELETKFASAVAEGGGKAFSAWFADDAVSLANGKPAIMGKTAIAAQAQWDPKEYQLTWVAQGAQMGPSNEMGFTWGHYQSTFKDQYGQAVMTTGRYMTIWKKVPDGPGQQGGWKVALESSAEEPPDAGSCCTLPQP